MKIKHVTQGLLFGLLFSAAVLLAVHCFGCGGKIFPKCDDPSKPNGGCPPVEPSYPPLGSSTDSGSDARDAG